ncbi:hypothetical protein HFO56_00980 [Rhizobium laguerreae]|uniref:hypothetical protein n=1 Tax=Rhizobium laguerreae TaxID=1076926 RepID=UPI001C916197|nr:hypothetical protein [Rhizobium laguerreae]MBY3151004.1 hypothetical protein [Rhizobium laguerreae]MBY3433187.1 hypothetical protein [Rhizobium laguerreae]
MPTIDFATAEAYVDDERLELYVPFEQKALGAFVKEKFKARFQTDGNKKRWVVEYKFARATPEQIVAAVEEELYRLAIPSWRQIVSMFVSYACASRRYEVKFASGGIRIMLPGGHPLHYYLGKMTGLKAERDVWKIPGHLVDPKEIAEMLKRISREDREVFKDATEPYEGRTISGNLLIPFSEAKKYGVGPDAIVFADYAFVKVADPQIVEMQIHAWPFRVLKTEPAEGAVRATLAYMEADPGARAVGKLMAMPRDERPKLLDEVHADGKWKSRSGY